MDEVNTTIANMPPWWEVARIVFSTLMAGAFAVMVWRSRTAKIYKEERDAALEQIKRLTEERKSLRDESIVLKEKVAVLEAQRDLTTVQEGQSAIVRAIEGLSVHESERFTKLAEAVAQNTKVILGFQSQMAGVFDAYQQSAVEMVTLLKEINNNTRT